MSLISEKVAAFPPAAQAVFSIALMLFFGFLMTRLTKLAKLPNVTAYILTGILLGPCCLRMIPARIVSELDAVPDVALALIAFGAGEHFRLDVLRKNSSGVLLITVLESFTASLCVFLTCNFLLGLSLAFSAMLAALAAATAPASTMLTIRQTGASGDFVETLLQVVALDDAAGLIAYSAAVSLALYSLGSGGSAVHAVVRPILANLLALFLGALFGLCLKLLLRRRSDDNRLILSVSMLLGFCGICALLEISPLLGCMSMGMVYSNLTGDHILFRQLECFSPPILLLFFVKSGLDFRLDTLFSAQNPTTSVPLLLVGMTYFFARIIGKYGGAYLGCLAAGKPKSIRNYLGLALIPQAGVAIGLAALGARTLGGQIGTDLQTIILASSVLYELIGPVCAKLALHLSGAIPQKKSDPQ